MRFFSELTIKRKLIGIIMGTSAVALVVAGTGLAVNDLQAGKRSLVNRLATQADIIGANSSAALLFDDPASAEQTLSALQAEPSILAAAIFSPNGTLFASYVRGVNRSDFLPTDRRGRSHWLADGYLHLFRPIVLGGEQTGSVYLQAGLNELYAQLRYQIAIIILVLLASAILALVLSSRLQRMISEPILHLTSTAKAISKRKNYALRVEQTSQDELGILINAFNEMLIQIQERDAALEGHRAHLEDLVALRTAEWRTVNQKLEHQTRHLEDLVALRTAELNQLNEQLKHQAHHDVLTGLPNRTLFNDRLTQDLLHARRRGQTLAVMFLDLDRFKLINDTLGHAVGDELLRMVAERLSQCVREDDTVARLGGDEFTILLSDIANAADAGTIARKIINDLAVPFLCSGRELHITTSIGIALYPKDGKDAGTLMRNADIGMYSAKAKGRNRWRLYSAELSVLSSERLEMENRLRQALVRSDFVVHYQPQWDIRGERIVGLEALVRWKHPELGLVLPAEFIPLLEDTGMIVPVGEWVLRTACAQIKVWRSAGLPSIPVAVNFSSRQFVHRSLAERVGEILNENGLERGSLVLEITESILIENAKETLATLHDMSAMGISLAIDDFGTGYSSLSYLKRFPIAAVKIDKSFVHDIATDADDAAIVKTIIAMAHNLNLKVTAEGVESREQLAFLQAHRCDAVQGFLFSPPLSSADIHAYFVRYGLLGQARPTLRSTV